MKPETSVRDKRGERGEGGGAEKKASPAAQAADGDFYASAEEEEEEEDVPDTEEVEGQPRPKGGSRALYLISMLGT